MKVAFVMRFDNVDNITRITDRITDTGVFRCFYVFLGVFRCF